MADAESGGPTSVLDTSALMAFLLEEEGKAVVAEADCTEVARLRPLTKAQGAEADIATEVTLIR